MLLIHDVVSDDELKVVTMPSVIMVSTTAQISNVHFKNYFQLPSLAVKTIRTSGLRCKVIGPMVSGGRRRWRGRRMRRRIRRRKTKEEK